MADKTRNHLTGMLLSKSRRAQYVKTFAILAVCVMAAVAFALHYTGIAMTHKEQVLSCPVAERIAEAEANGEIPPAIAHTHNEDCYDKDGNLVCPLEEKELHEHTEDCYTTEEYLICGLEETEGHVHTDECYDETGGLICGLEETEGHFHTDECYEIERTLTCGKEEVTEEHVHGSGCFETVTVRDDEDDSLLDNQSNDEVAEYLPAQNFEQSVLNKKGDEILRVTVEAPEGAFPEGTTMEVTRVKSSEVADAVSEAMTDAGDERNVDSMQAVDIVFYDTDGNEIEPRCPITVSMTSDKIGNERTSPVLVHVNNDGKGEVVDQLSDDQAADRKLENGNDTLSFDSDAFSVYIIAYTVDYHYEVDGKTFEFSIPGGGFVNFTDLIEVLGVTGETNPEEIVLDSEEVYGENGLTLSEVEVSEETKEFVVDVESIEFSNPDLVWVGKVKTDSTVGELKEAKGLDVQYSAELTKEQIEEINAQTVEAGDWALISVLPFTSEESLTVTMKTGEVFTIKVTDAQIVQDFITAKGETYTITVNYTDEAEIPNGSKLSVRELEENSSEYQEYLSGSAEKLGVEDSEISFARFFDIEIWDDNQKIEPKSDVSVTIVLKDVPQEASSDLQLIHFAMDGVELMKTKQNSDEENEGYITELTFITDEFSIYSITSTARGGVDSILNKEYVLVCNNVALSSEQNTTSGFQSNLRGIPVTISNGKITTTKSSDSLSTWTVKKNGNGNNYYLTTIVNGETKYLHLGSSNGAGASVSSQTQNLNIETRNNNSQYRFKRSDANQAIDLFDANGEHGFGSYDGNRENEFFTLYEVSAESVDDEPLNDENREEVTIHFVDRDGHPLDGVTYTGNLGDQLVTSKGNGVFSVPYNWNRVSGTVDVGTDFIKNGYTYANTHLAKNTNNNSWTGSNYNQNGMLIESTFRSDGSKLYFQTHKGGSNTYDTPSDYSFSDRFTTYPPNDSTEREYAIAGNKDVYVVLDPVSNTDSGSESGSGGESGSGQQPTDTDPIFKKQVTSNEDGTYNLALSVTGRALNYSEQPKVNVLLVVDTSSSMVSNNDPVSGNTRLHETQNSLIQFGEQLFARNGTGAAGSTPSDTVQVAMVTFDSTATNNMSWTTSKSEFDNKVNSLQTHKGTNWEEALHLAYTTAQTQYELDHDPTFVIFFTDGEPSQYTNFHQDPHPYNSWKYFFAFLSREAAKDEAREIVSAGLRFYTVFAYGGSNTNKFHGESVNGLLSNLVNYAYNNTSASDTYSYTAENATAINQAFTELLRSINNVLGVSDVVMNDSITSLTSIGASIDSNSKAQGFWYTRTGGQYGSTPQKWNDAPSVTYDTNGIHWNLGNQVLEDGVTYTVNVTIWPSQKAYDYVTKLNNGVISSIDAIPESDRSCFIYNSTTGKYEVITNPESGPHGNSVTNEITYTKNQSQTVSLLPYGASTDSSNPVIVNPGQNDWPRVTTKTWYTENNDGTWTKHVISEVVTAFNPPDQNMVLDATDIKVRKYWEADRKDAIVKYLYNTNTGEPYDNHKYIDFEINQIDDSDNPIKFGELRLGFNDEKNSFEWKGSTEVVTVKDRDYTVGEYWEKDTSISYGLILSKGYASARGLYLDDPRYIKVYSNETDRAADRVAYYVLETGHDYKVNEPTLDYRFDFLTEVYHPMLVDGVPSGVKIQYFQDGDSKYGILDETDNVTWLQGKNVLRGQLEMTKSVLDSAGDIDTNNDDVFEFEVTLENDKNPGPFYNVNNDSDQQNIPWYGVEDSETGYVLYYHKIDPLEDGSILYVDEQTACENGNYNDGLKPGYAGNIMVPDSTNPRNKVTANIKMNAKDKWVITNIPVGTIYTIQEVGIKDGYSFVRALQTAPVQNDEDTDAQDSDDEDSGIEDFIINGISGHVTENDMTTVKFTNRKYPEIHIIKIDINNINEDDPDRLPGAEFRLDKYTTENYTDLDKKWGSNGSESVVEAQEDSGEFKFVGISEGYYKIVETKYPDGYVGTEEDPIFRVVKDEDQNYKIELLTYDNNGNIIRLENNMSDSIKVNDNINEIMYITYGNTPGKALPNTGGTGTMVFTVCGSLMVIIAAGFLLNARFKYV